MNEIRFKHYEGTTYQGENFKIFVLGESHYFSEKDLNSFNNKEKHIENVTKNVVEMYLQYKQGTIKSATWMTTFTKFSNITSNAKLSNAETIQFWDKTIFYNFVQSPTKKPRSSPSQEEFIKSIEPFIKTVEATKPNLIFIWGYRLWNNVPKENLFTKTELNGKVIHLYNNIPIIVVPHPSSSKFNNSLKTEINNYIELVKDYTAQKHSR